MLSFRLRAGAMAFALASAWHATAWAEAQLEAADPPAAVGRIAILSGAVTFRAADDQPTSAAIANYPLSLGNVVATSPRAHATVDIAAGRFYLDGASEVRIGRLTDGATELSLRSGALILHLLPGGEGQVFTIATAAGAMRVDQPGYYEVEATDGTVTASAIEGGAQFRLATGEERVLHSGDRLVNAPGTSPATEPVAEDDFVRRVAGEIQDIGENAAPAPTHVSPQVTGFQDLRRYGLWELTAAHGPVWEPQVGSDWSPYTKGRWADVPPWGKTWIDDAPWGFAPFHYGRWVQINDRWGWVPGEPADPPVYAPALVSFFGTPRDHDKPAGWIPLGPDEPYLPPYPASFAYFQEINRAALPAVVNITNVVNITQVTNVVQIVEQRPVIILGRLVNRGGVGGGMVSLQTGSSSLVVGTIPGAGPPKRIAAPKPQWVPAMVVTKPGPLPPQFQNSASGSLTRSAETPLTTIVQRPPATTVTTPPAVRNMPVGGAQAPTLGQQQPTVTVAPVTVSKTVVNRPSNGGAGSIGSGNGPSVPSRPTLQHCTPTVGIACRVGP